MQRRIARILATATAGATITTLGFTGASSARSPWRIGGTGRHDSRRDDRHLLDLFGPSNHELLVFRLERGVEIGIHRDIALQPGELNRGFREAEIPLAVTTDRVLERPLPVRERPELGLEFPDDLIFDIVDLPVQLPHQRMLGRIVDQEIPSFLHQINHPLVERADEGFDLIRVHTCVPFAGQR